MDLRGASSRTDRRTGSVRRLRWWTEFAYLARRLDELVADLVADVELGPEATVVDYGCGEQPYRSLFRGRNYLAVDLPGNSRADVHTGANGSVPLPDASADLVLSTQVLVHVADPVAYLEECHRMLRPGGTLVLTTHGVMFAIRHPTDFWRWTCDGLRLIVEGARFAIAEQRGLMTLTAVGLQLAPA